MSSIKNEVTIHAAVSTVYAALTTQAGYRGWWNAVAEVPESVGGEAALNFMKEGNRVAMRYRIEELAPNERVRWLCIGHEFPLWVGTTLDWRLKQGGGSTTVLFEHAGWKEAPPEAVIQGWNHFVASLKSYVETGTGQPW